MVLQLPIEYDQLVEQLSEEQQRPLTVEEKIKLLDAIKIHTPVNG